MLDGGAGDDVLVGFSGRDTLSGGLGKDVFEYTLLGDSETGVSVDVITDFTVAAGTGLAFEDRLDLANLFLTSFIGTGVFTGVNQVRAIQSGLDTVVQVNLNAAAGAEMTIVLENFTATDLTASDFLL